MPSINVVVETDVSRSPRARQLEGMFDVPPSEKARLEWNVEIPIEARKWNVGLIVGPSGAGKTTIARELFGDALDRPLEWGGASVVDDFDSKLSMQDISRVCQAVGFNTIPAWLRPFRVLSNGEQFRVELARRLIEGDGLVVVEGRQQHQVSAPIPIDETAADGAKQEARALVVATLEQGRAQRPSDEARCPCH